MASNSGCREVLPAVGDEPMETPAGSSPAEEPSPPEAPHEEVRPFPKRKEFGLQKAQLSSPGSTWHSTPQWVVNLGTKGGPGAMNGWPLTEPPNVAESPEILQKFIF